MRNTVPLDGRLGAIAGDLPRPPGVIRRFWARHPWATDSIVAGGYLLLVGGALTLNAVSIDFAPWALALLLVSILVSATALLFRRYRPFTVLAVTWGLALVGAQLEEGLNSVAVSLPLALYALAVYRSTQAAWIGFGGSVIVGIAAAGLWTTLHRDAYGSSTPFETTTANSSQFTIVMLIAVLIGINVGNRKRYVAALIDRAEQLARERDQQAEIATASERARIAREMHDIVSHSLTVMVTLADGSAAAVAAKPGRATEGMLRVAETGRTALADMRRMLGVLGTSDVSELAPQPGIANLADLLETYRAAGLTVTIMTRGVPYTDPSVGLVIYRLIQESLTNALRHASSATGVQIELAYDNDATTIQILNDGATVESIGDGGHGIIGMRERVALYGGSVEVGPRPHGGWAVTAVLPRERQDDGTA
ncbi:MAG: sensor histidine kinase [Rhodoglobus sp.]